MIRTFLHKGLEKFFLTSSTKGIQAKHATKLRLILGLLHRAKSIEDVNFHGSNLHALKGDKKGFWSVWVNGNWRIIFRFENGHADKVDYIDYH